MINPDALRSIRERIEEAGVRAHREQDPPTQIVAVTKTFPAATIEAAYEAGITTIGENRVQEAAEKFPELPHLPQLKKRLVGHLQSNKARKAMALFDVIDSIDSLKLARRLNAIAGETERRSEVLLQVNTANDPAKHGFEVAEMDTLLEIMEMDNLKVEGLMTIGEFTPNETVVRKTFRSLRELRDQLNEHLPAEKNLSELSMGMSGDFEIAVEEGATMVRLGTVLFGARRR